uniref:mRNA cap 0 methyltransferase domain-containing protein n=1 Tax=viral metagenome TaxID=1070528 RepID=A0A6C0F7E1_9ZZZZ|tara:strand:- start:5342 stop:9529 length:4188 start_codon:yes stop_codon:yes gene_type:complete
MKLFSNNDKVKDYFKNAIDDSNLELELIFGYNPQENPINKKEFMNVLRKCETTYKKISETVNLDIRIDYKGNPSSVRGTIHGLDSIKKYCKNNNLLSVKDNLEFIEKKNSNKTGFETIRDDNFNVRLTLKSENNLSMNHRFVTSFINDVDNKNKHYRYKKRISFVTDDKMFRIDLTVVKSTNYYRGKYDFKKSFKEANILSNKETFELEVEYLGWSKNVGVQEVDELFQTLNETIETEIKHKSIGNIYDPLNLGIVIKDDIPEDDYPSEDYVYEIDSPKYESVAPTLYLNYETSNIRYSYDHYRALLGKFTRIKKEYFVGSGIDMKVFYALEEYYKRGMDIGIISNIYETVEDNFTEDTSGMKYIDTIVNISLYPSIGGINKIDVPLKYIYGGNYTIEEDIIREGRDLDDSKKKQSIEEEELKELTKSKDKETSELAKSALSKGGASITDVKNDKINEIINYLLNKLEQNIVLLSKVVYETDKLISYKLKKSVINKYREITGQYAKYFTFIGPQPKTLNQECIMPNNPKSIIVDYAVTEKADGVRYQLFIFNKNGYLINSKENVIDTGCHFKYLTGEWIIDGEYITKDKYNQPMNKFMAFDVYWCGLKSIPQPAHTYPFLARDPLDDGARYNFLKEFERLITENPSISFKPAIEKMNETNTSTIWKQKLKEQGINTDSIVTEELKKEYIAILSNEKDEPIIHYGENNISIGVKNYEFGYQSENNEDKVNVSDLSKNDATKIFSVSKSILKKDKDYYYDYRIDGLIYLPTRLSVNGSIEGFQSKKIYGTWPLNYKWKPPEENTIDFKVKIKKEMVDGKLIDKEIPYVSHQDGVRVVGKYKQVELYVGYKECEDKSINYCMKVMMSEDIIKLNDNNLQLFNVNGPEDERYNITNIPLTNGKLLCDNFDKDQINDGDIVEMRFERDAENSMYWVPIRVRSDKIKPQFFDIAYDVWDTINNPVTESMINGVDFIKDKDIFEDNTGKYYVNENNNILSESEKLRKLHNFIKSKLIGGTMSSFNGKVKVLDLSCGQGGDIQKYVNYRSNVSLLVGIDISSNIHEACRRFYCNKDKQKTKAAFFRGDTSKNIMRGEVSEVEDGSPEDKKHTDTIINIIYNKKSKIPKEYEDINNRFNGIAQSGFDIVSSQFSLHYYFKNKSTLDGFIENLKDNVKHNGYFIGTCYNGEYIFNYFEERRKHFEKIRLIENEGLSSDEEDEDYEKEMRDKERQFIYTDTKGNVVFSIEKDYDIEDFKYNRGDESNLFGNKINVYMDSIGQNIPEYLVNFDYFKEIMEENGFELSIPNVKINHHIFRKDYFDNGLGQFSTIISNLNEISHKDKDLKKIDKSGNNIAYYKEALDMRADFDYYDRSKKRNVVKERSTVSPLLTLSSFNNYFIFKRVN